jgi:hypothetical protein
MGSTTLSTRVSQQEAAEGKAGLGAGVEQADNGAGSGEADVNQGERLCAKGDEQQRIGGSLRQGQRHTHQKRVGKQQQHHTPLDGLHIEQGGKTVLPATHGRPFGKGTRNQVAAAQGV